MTHQDILVKKVGDDEIRLRTWINSRHTIMSVAIIGSVFLIGTVITATGFATNNIMPNNTSSGLMIVILSLFGGVVFFAFYSILFMFHKYPYMETIPSYRVYLKNYYKAEYKFSINPPTDKLEIYTAIKLLTEKAMKYENEKSELEQLVRSVVE